MIFPVRDFILTNLCINKNTYVNILKSNIAKMYPKKLQ